RFSCWLFAARVLVVAIGVVFGFPTLASAANLPGAPTLTAISGDSYGTVRLTWTPPSSNGGAPLLGYELDRSTDGGATWINDYQGYAGNATIGNTDCGSTPG